MNFNFFKKFVGKQNPEGKYETLKVNVFFLKKKQFCVFSLL